MRHKSGLNFGKRRKKFNINLFKEIMAWAVEIAIVIFVAYVCVSFFCVRSTVVGQAMEDHLVNGDRIFVNRFVYMITKPKAGDVVVFLPNGNEKSHYYVRRVIGTPGDKVQIKDGAVYINGKLYSETFLADAMEDPGIAENEIVLAKDEYFVLGDNRNNSEDSRFANIGNVKKKDIVGQAWFKFTSFNNMGFVH